MAGAITPSRVLPSAKLVVDDGSLVIINIVGDSILNRVIHGAVNRIGAIVKGYRVKCASAENSIYIPISSVSSVGKKRCSKLRGALTSLAVPLAMFLFGTEISIWLAVLLLLVSAILATAFYVITGNRYALTIEINSSFEYLLTTNDPEFVEIVYNAIKNIIDTTPTQPVVNKITYNFINASVIDSVVTAKILGS